MNTALRNHDERGLEPFLPYMKLLLSALYQLPLMHVRTYRGVKLELYEVSSIPLEQEGRGARYLYRAEGLGLRVTNISQ